MAGTYHFETVRGDTFNRTLTYKDSSGNAIDTSGFSGKMHLRKTVSTSSPTLELTDGNGRISFGGADGTITLSVDAADMAIDARTYEYDLEITDGNGDVKTLLRGTFTVHPEVSR